MSSILAIAYCDGVEEVPGGRDLVCPKCGRINISGAASVRFSLVNRHCCYHLICQGNDAAARCGMNGGMLWLILFAHLLRAQRMDSIPLKYASLNIYCYDWGPMVAIIEQVHNITG